MDGDSEMKCPANKGGGEIAAFLRRHVDDSRDTQRGPEEQRVVGDRGMRGTPELKNELGRSGYFWQFGHQNDGIRSINYLL